MQQDDYKIGYYYNYNSKFTARSLYTTLVSSFGQVSMLLFLVSYWLKIDRVKVKKFKFFPQLGPTGINM